MVESQQDEDSGEEDHIDFVNNVDGKNPCARTGEDLEGVSGKKFRMECPAKCAEEPGNIVGTGVYHYESVICKAAIHDGMI